MGLERRPCSVDLDGGQVEVVRRLSDASVATRGKHTWAYAHSGVARRWDEARHQLIFVLPEASPITYFPV